MADRIPPPPRTSELVVARMQESIRSGQWPVGERIPAEPDLVEQFGVGRNTIREAVRALEHAGMLSPRRGDGTYVRSASMLAAPIARCVPDRRRRELLSARQAVEAEAAAVAATGADAAHVAELRLCLMRVEQALVDGELSAYVKDDMAFHDAVVAASGNGLLIELHGGIVEVMQRMYPRGIDAPVAAGVRLPVYRELVDAVAGGDPSAARAAVLAHFDTAHVDPAHADPARRGLPG